MRHQRTSYVTVPGSALPQGAPPSQAQVPLPTRQPPCRGRASWRQDAKAGGVNASVRGVRQAFFSCSLPQVTAPASASVPAWVIHCDGSAVPNPGRMGMGAVLSAPDGTQHTLCQLAPTKGCPWPGPGARSQSAGDLLRQPRRGGPARRCAQPACGPAGCPVRASARIARVF